MASAVIRGCPKWHKLNVMSTLFRNGRNQALRIPRELEWDEAILRKEGDRLIVEPVRKGR